MSSPRPSGSHVTAHAGTSQVKFTALEEMNHEGLVLLRQKEAELKQYTETVARAEQILTQLQQQIQEKTSELESITGDEEDPQSQQAEIERELAELDAKHQQEIEALKAKHDDELATLRADFEQTLEESRQWAARHAEIALQEKLDELQQLKAEAKEAKRQLNELTFVKNRSKATRFVDSNQKDNAEQISRLEEQISELTALTREELRDARAKIDECVAAVELRRQSHAAEIKRLDDEAAQRNERYQAHLSALREQYELERLTIEQQIQAAEGRAANTEKIIEKLEHHHQTQLKEVLGDMETMRRSFGSPAKRNKQNAESMRAIVREAQRLADECKGVEEETRVIDAEIGELENENRDLRQELARLSALMESKSH
jgi:chromosome segregation ATPase